MTEKTFISTREIGRSGRILADGNVLELQSCSAADCRKGEKACRGMPLAQRAHVGGCRKVSARPARSWPASFPDHALQADARHYRLVWPGDSLLTLVEHARAGLLHRDAPIPKNIA